MSIELMEWLPGDSHPAENTNLSVREEYERYTEGKLIPLPENTDTLPLLRVKVNKFDLVVNPVAGVVIMVDQIEFDDLTIKRIYLHPTHQRYEELKEFLRNKFPDTVTLLCRYNKDGNLIKFFVEDIC